MTQLRVRIRLCQKNVDPSPPAPPHRASLRQLPSVQAALSVNAHAVLASSCTLMSPRRRSAALADTANSCASDWPAIATCPAGTTDSAWNSWAICALAVILLCLASCQKQSKCATRAQPSTNIRCFLSVPHLSKRLYLET